MFPYQNVLVIVPHSDDEVLIAGGIIRRCILEKKKIHVAIVTNGDYMATTAKKGETRLLESIDALTYLGMDEKDISFLGYPDTGMEKDVSFLYRLKEAKEDTIFPSFYSNCTYGIKDKKAELHYQLYGKHALYSRKSFENDIHDLIEQIDPDLVITSSEYDLHGDHSALSYFVRNELKSRKKDGRISVLWEALIHSMDGDDQWPIKEDFQEAFTKPLKWETQEILSWEDRIQIPLPKQMITSSFIINQKYEAIQKYRMALNPNEPEVVAYLCSFAKEEEIFWKISLN